MRVDRFDFELPNERIALRPVFPRDAAQMLVVNQPQAGHMQDATVASLPHILRPGDALVFNNTRVIPAQLEGLRLRQTPSGLLEAKISLTLHMRLSGNRWLAFARGAKKLQSGDRLEFSNNHLSFSSRALSATIVVKGQDGEVEIEFDCADVDLDEALADVGHIPLPPYISAQRAEDDRDRQDYQTIYANEDGAVAAPTAGLHFTRELMASLVANDISAHFVTLHVGAGTFLPVKVADTNDHKMHSEWGVVSQKTAEELNSIRKNGGRIVSVGTTSLRLLESAAGINGAINPWSGTTDIFITPGYSFRTVDVLMTNFHLPRSTLFMLVSAFAGFETMRRAYQHAIDNKYRFYSYGDSSLLFPALS